MIINKYSIDKDFVFPSNNNRPFRHDWIILTIDVQINKAKKIQYKIVYDGLLQIAKSVIFVGV